MKTYCINLDERTDRWKHAVEQFAILGWPVSRVAAIKAEPGWVGCRDTHLKILRELYDNKEDALILEDDVQFLIDPEDLLERIMEQLPGNWDMLYFGASPNQPQERFSPNLFRINNAHVTHAIMWHCRKGGAMEYVLNHAQDIEKIDDFFAVEVQPRFNCYVSSPMICTQYDNVSNIAHRSDVSTIGKNYKLYCV